GQAEVDEREVERAARGERQAFLRARGRGDLGVRIELAQQRGEAVAEERMVVDEKELERHGRKCVAKPGDAQRGRYLRIGPIPWSDSPPGASRSAWRQGDSCIQRVRRSPLSFSSC